MFKRIQLVKKIFARMLFGIKNIFLLAIGKTLKPRWIWFGVTDHCNSHCTHCQIWAKKGTENQLTLAEIEKVLRDPLLSEVETIINSGGEAILRDDIVEIIKLENKIFPQASLDLSTNGILAERALTVVKAVLSENIKINVGVSLDGLGEKHDKIRGVPGNFNKVDYLLKQLVTLREEYPNKLSVVIGFTLSDLTINNWEEVRDYAEKIQVELMVQWYNQSTFYDNIAGQDNVHNNKMVEIVSKQPYTIIREKWLKLLRGQPIKYKCFAAQTFFVLRCDGNITPCLSYWDEILGNIRENSVTEIWQNEKAEKARKKVSRCSGCLNSWGVEWSISTIFFPRLWFYLKTPGAIRDRLKRKN